MTASPRSRMLDFRKDKEAFANVDTLLTLVIALGGIATGIGAIWAAVAARRQAQVTERSLALTERSLAEQNERAREESERARLSFEVDMSLKLEDRWDNPTYRNRRGKAAEHIKEHFFTDDGGLLDVEHIDDSTRELLNFYELVGHLVGQGVLRPQTVWNRFGVSARVHWALVRPAIEKLREEEKDPTMFEDFEHLDALLADLDRERGVGEEYISKQQLRYYVQTSP